ncbi:GntR family transcriptional regulator [Xaviernesmea oryzae]|uniref:GntR family transcriptional regulator n=1 Tax=Xaviernesmea oryzae TaxID=464029 RepID=A0A1Q9B081_9HYPH|nr:PLP-dependent aminotransferase family protein [Xaviernesmea oryzae]OLP61388.1 GntR family transcriptional regulator [Xaviernesmea oryzae]SEL71121.1 DNA-binding transcriptional regulator, MocR family, contains an aminotransferase domain [Xaviernesmea oryzae]
MTTWLPNLSEGSGPLYLRLADAIETAIDAGALSPGDKLPPQRNLAFDIGVTLGTVSRAYGLVHERGLVAGEVGRGTYVRERGATGAPPTATSPLAHELGSSRSMDPPDGKLRFDSTGAPDIGQSEILERVIAGTVADHPAEVASYARNTPAHWQEAGTLWLARDGFSPEPEDVVTTQGAHAAIMAVVTAVTAPGDKVLFESVTYTHIARALGLAGRRVITSEIDEEGLVPEEFERVCQQQHPAMAFLMPSAQNPTLAVMSLARRRQIAEIARRHNVFLIEDDIYGVLARPEIPMLATLAPERTFVVSGLAKAVAAGIRGGWVACPPNMAARVRVAQKMLTGGLAFVLAESSARLVLSGEADAIRLKVSAELAARHAIVHEGLAGHVFRAAPHIPFFWIDLPDPWLSGTFKAAAFAAGVLVDDEDEFKAGRSDRVLHKARVGFSNHRREDIRRGIAILRGLLDGGLSGYEGGI